MYQVKLTKAALKQLPYLKAAGLAKKPKPLWNCWLRTRSARRRLTKS